MASQIPSLIARAAAGGVNSATTPAMTTTGASLLVAVVAVSNSVAPSVISDSKSNTWTGLTGHGVASNQNTQIWYAANPTVGTSHTITSTLTGGASGLVGMAFSGIVTASPFDQQNGATAAGSGTTLATGSITPSVNGALIIAALGQGASLATDGQILIDDLIFSIMGGVFGILAVSSSTWGTFVSFGVQTTAAAINPTWTLVQGTGINSNLSAAIASFKPATAASGGSGGAWAFA